MLEDKDEKVQNVRLGQCRRRKPRELRSRTSLLEDHYRVDLNEKVVLPGVHQYDDDFKRDCHDFFNLIVLVPIIVLNALCWDWDILLDLHSDKSIKEAWNGAEWFRLFWLSTMAYFVLDLIWVAVFPSCVKSPGTIIKHHIATLLYILIPHYRSRYEWCMGACMSVEINTWFLIARRIFNKQGFPPWIIKLPPLISIRVKLISIFFYTTWVMIRCILYPVLLHHFVTEHGMLMDMYGTPWNTMAIVVPLHTVFCVLNLKWSYDLLNSKIRYWRKTKRSKGGRKDDILSQGL